MTHNHAPSGGYKNGVKTQSAHFTRIAPFPLWRIHTFYRLLGGQGWHKGGWLFRRLLNAAFFLKNAYDELPNVIRAFDETLDPSLCSCDRSIKSTGSKALFELNDNSPFY